jgi:hypothetical protein
MQTHITQKTRHHSYKQDANNMLTQTKNRLEQREIELKNILRWEDDGGQLETAEKQKFYFTTFDN